MKLSVKPNTLKYLALGAGAVALALQLLLYATGLDASGLLRRGHFAAILIGLLSVVTLAGLLVLTRNITGPQLYADCFRNSAINGLGCLAAAAGILLTSISESADPADKVALLTQVLGFASAGALVAIGGCRLMGAKPFFLLHVVPCVYFAVRMVCQYRFWSSDPQLQDYCFQLLACVALMLTSYQHAAFDADMGSHSRLWLFSLMSVYLCCLSIAGPESRLLYLGTGIWAFTDLSCLTAKTRRQRPSLNLEDAPGIQED